MRSFLRVLDVDLGFQPERAVAVRVDPNSRFQNLEQQNAYFDDMLRRTRALPGVVAPGLTDVLPLEGDRSWQVSGRGQIYPPDRHPEAFIRVVSDAYVEAVGVRLKSGRVFTERDRASTEPVAIVNEACARTLWPGQNAVGQVVTQDGGRRVVGVVADVRHEALEKAAESQMYLPIRQTGDYPLVDLVVRTAIPPDRLASAVRAALWPIDPHLAVNEFKPLQDSVDKAGSPRRSLVLLLAGFASFALLLAAYSRTRCRGLALGMAASRVLTTALGSFLFGVTPGDPVTFIEMGALLIAVAALAGYLPARRASRIDPMVALRAS